MGIMSWLGRKIGLTDGDFWRAFYGGETWAGEPVTPHTAMQVSAFWACVKIISQTIATLPIGVYQKNRDGSRTLLQDTTLYGILHDIPNSEMTAVEFWEGMAAALCLSGNGFAKKELNGQGDVIGLQPLCSDFMTIDRVNRTGPLRYTYQDPVRGTQIYSPDQLLHLKGFGLGGDVGLSPLTYARQSLSSARAADRAASSVFANGLRPSGWLVYKGGVLTPEQRDQAKKVIVEPMMGAENAGKIGILEADFDWKPATMSFEDAQMLETRQFNVEDVCRWLGVPPILVGHASQGQTMWGSGIEQILIGWLTLGLRPYLTRIEQSIKRSLILPGERASTYAEFNVEGLLRADSAGRAALYATFAQNGIMTRNEIRAKENLPKAEGGDELTVQVNLQTLRSLVDGTATQPQVDQLKNALRSFLGVDEERPQLRLVSGGNS